MALTLGVPFKLLKDFTNRKVNVETSSGDSYKGTLVEAEENMSMSLTGVRCTFVDGRTGEMENVYIKGSRVRLISLPDSAKDALTSLTREQSGGFRGGRGGFRGKPSYDRRRY